MSVLSIAPRKRTLFHGMEWGGSGRFRAVVASTFCSTSAVPIAGQNAKTKSASRASKPAKLVGPPIAGKLQVNARMIASSRALLQLFENSECQAPADASG